MTLPTRQGRDNLVRTHLEGRMMATFDRFSHHPIVRAGATVGLVGLWFWLEIGLRRRRLSTWIS